MDRPDSGIPRDSFRWETALDGVTGRPQQVWRGRAVIPQNDGVSTHGVRF